MQTWLSWELRKDSKVQKSAHLMHTAESCDRHSQMQPTQTDHLDNPFKAKSISFDTLEVYVFMYFCVKQLVWHFSSDS